jgi:hypothetical protein
LLLWHRTRFLAARSDASPEETTYLASAAREYRNRADEIPRQPSVVVARLPSVHVTGEELIELTSVAEGTIDVSVRNVSVSDENVWVALEYDPNVITVRPLSSRTVYNMSHLRQVADENSSASQADGSEFNYPTLPDPQSPPATILLRAGRTETFRFVIRRNAPLAFAARLAVRAITARYSVRHEIKVAVPFPDTINLTVTGIPGSFATSSRQFVLHPFPNQETKYRLSLSNDSPEDKKVQVEFLVLQRSPSVEVNQAALPTAAADTLLARLGPTIPLLNVPDVTLPAGGREVPIPFPLPPATPPPPAEGETPADDQESEADKKPAPKPAAKPALPPVPIRHGILMVITEPKLKQKTIKRIDYSPQHPRRYIRPRVDYNAQKERIEITVVPNDRSLLPTGGVRVRCEFADPLAPDVDAQLDGEVKEPRYSANLYADVPLSGNRVVTLSLTVDGYPRAFVYRVPCSSERLDIDEASGLLDITILKPAPGEAVKAPIDVVPVKVRVNAPPGSFQNDRSYVELGIDRDRDREFQGDETIKLFPDRQPEVVVARAAPGGVFVVDAQVGDFQVDVPVAGVRNARVNVLGRVVTGERMAWSQPVEFVVDGSGPKVDRITLRGSSVLVIGKPALVTVRTSDAGLSGIEKVEVAVDVDRKGEFGGAPPPKPAEIQPSGEWSAQLDTAPLKPGSYNLLVRATDQVGNESEYGRLKVRVVTAEQAERLRSMKTNRVTGTVEYGGKPFANIEVTLTAAAPPQPATGAEAKAAAPAASSPKIAPTTTDAQGRFTFPKVPPGKYVLFAEGVVRNKRRRAEVDITVKPSPAPIVNRQLTLK